MYPTNVMKKGGTLHVGPVSRNARFSGRALAWCP